LLIASPEVDMLRARLIAVTAAVVSVGVSVFACGGSDSGVSSGNGDDSGTETGSTTPPTTPPTNPPPPPPVDAGDDADITDGGSNFDPDAGDDGGLPDGGKCNTVDDTATAITSTCVSKRPILGGGALVSGTYFLIAVRDLGTVGFCASTFVPTGFKETLVLAVAGATATADTAGTVATLGTRRTTTTFTTNAANTSPMTGQETCPVVGAGGPVPYASVLTPAGKQNLVMILPYGKGEAVYTFEKQP
jgi:hypothetical protein